MKVFISWAGKSTEAFALELHNWIKPALSLDSWCSAAAECLPQGGSASGGFVQAIFEGIDTSNFCILVMTRESIERPWLNFEAGAFYGQKKTVFTLLCGDITHSHLAKTSHPTSASGMNHTTFSKDGLTRIFTAILANHRDSATVSRMVDRWFSDIETKYNEIFNQRFNDITDALATDCDD